MEHFDTEYLTRLDVNFDEHFEIKKKNLNLIYF